MRGPYPHLRKESDPIRVQEQARPQSQSRSAVVGINGTPTHVYKQMHSHVRVHHRRSNSLSQGQWIDETPALLTATYLDYRPDQIHQAFATGGPGRLENDQTDGKGRPQIAGRYNIM